jgi:CHAT domain-containing protein/Flp pilus assembly protein TadD
MTKDSPQPSCTSKNLHFLTRSAAIGLLSGIFPASALSIPLHQSSAAPQASATQVEAAPLEIGKPITLELKDATKHGFSFDLNQGQYTAVLLDCPKMSGVARVFDGAGKLIDRTYGNERNTRERIELVAEKPEHLRLEVEKKKAQDGGTLCTIIREPSRPAAEKEALLQRARTLIAPASDLMAAGKDTEAAEMLQKAVELREGVLGAEDPSLAFPLSVLGDTYLRKEDYPKAQEVFLRALKLQDKADPQGVGAYSILNNLSITYIRMDRFDEAERGLLRSISVAQKIWGPGQPAAINPMVNLGNLYDIQGDYLKAQDLYERAIADAEKVVGPDEPGLAVIISNLAGVYTERGDYESAIHLGQRAVAIVDKPGRQEDHRLALALGSLGDAYRYQGHPEKAEPLYERSLKIWEKVRGGRAPELADTLTYLADIYRDRHDYAKAEQFYLRALEIRRERLGEGHADVGASLHDLGTLYAGQTDYARAEPLFRQALTIRQKELGQYHPDVAETLTSLSALEMATGHAVEAESFLARAISINEHNASLNLTTGSEAQKLDYVRLSSAQLDRAITLSSSLAPTLADARDLAVTTVLQRKGRVLDVLAGNLQMLRQSLDADGGKLLDQLDEVTSHLARLVLGGPQDAPVAEHEKRINALKEQRAELEAEISRRSAQFRAAAQPVTLEAVRAALPANSALLEFVSYQKLLSAGPEDKTSPKDLRYIVYLIRPTGTVEWRELGEADKLDQEIDAYREALRDPDRKDVNQLARQLDEKILRPLRPLLGGASHLFISPDGQLSLIPFEALVDRQHRYAVERYSITYLSSGRDLLRMQATGESKSGPVIVADPLFGEPKTEQLAGVYHQSRKGQRRSITTAADLSSVYFAPLAGTAEEARSIHALFPDATVLTGARASVANLKQVKAPRILHIATHGFFLEDRQNGSMAAPGHVRGQEGSHGANLDLENPLLRAGLAFANANLKRTGKDNGILTALQASNLNLWGTKLVTLSACDTGIGEVRDREGVYGLRRAFVLAGAETLVMSLWPVSDYVTRETITAYYAGLKKGLGRGEALRLAELATMKRKGRRHPFYWASFIQFGEWANLDGRR